MDDDHDNDNKSHLLIQLCVDIAEEGEKDMVKEHEVIIIDDDDVVEPSEVQKPSDQVLTASLIVLLTVAITRQINLLVKAGCERC